MAQININAMRLQSPHGRHTNKQSRASSIITICLLLATCCGLHHTPQAGAAHRSAPGRGLGGPSSTTGPPPVVQDPNARPHLSGGSQSSGHHQLNPKIPLQSRQFGDMVNDIHIECNSDNIVVTLATSHGFNGLIYPKGMSKNSTCMSEYNQSHANITYLLPLRSCNTMNSEVEDGIEYFNTLMIQPHRRLVTNQGRGYHIRCRYQTKERTITNQEQLLNVNLTQSTPAVVGSASTPSCSMKIFSTNDLNREVSAENVKIGDELRLVITLEEQDVYGMLVTNCLVRDGMNWGEQPLIDEVGCPVDEEIMPQFVYSRNQTKAEVSFQAHKFPYTSSVYYQCNVKLCFKETGCQQVPPNCDRQPLYRALEGSNELHGARHRRWLDAGELDGSASGDLLRPTASAGPDKSIQVFSGLSVAEGDLAEAESSDSPVSMASSRRQGRAAADDDPDGAEQPTENNNNNGKTAKRSDREMCLSMRRFAIIVSLCSLMLLLAMLIIAACLVHRNRRRRKLVEEASQRQDDLSSSAAYEQHGRSHRYYRE